MRITITLSNDIYKKLKKHAKENVRTLSQEIEYQLKTLYSNTDTSTSKDFTPPVFIAPDLPTPRPDPFPEYPYKITCDVKTPTVTQTYTSEQDHITQSPEDDYDPTRLTPYTYKADDFTFKSPAEELPKIPISSITVPAISTTRGQIDATIEYFEQDNTIQYHIPTDTFIPTSYFGTLLTDIACHNQRDLPVLSTAEKLIVDYIYNLYPPDTYVPALLLNMKDALDDPDKLETEQDQILFSMLQKDGDHRHRDIPTECDYIEKKYLEVHPE